MATRIKSSQITDGSIVAADLHSAIAVNTTASGTFGSVIVDNITIDGSSLTTSGINDFTVDSGGLIVLDADSTYGDIRLANSSSQYAALYNSGDHLYIKSIINEGDVYLSGKDSSGNHIDGLILDFGNSGRATFNENVSVGGNLTVTGDLTVEGTQVTLNTTALDVEDKNITLNYHASNDTSASADGAGITIQDAVSQGNDATILWDATNDKFEFSHETQVYGNLSVGVGNSKEAFIQATNSGRVASNPAYSFRSDVDTGMFNPNIDNTIAFATGGTERLRIDSSGNSTFYDTAGDPGMVWDAGEGSDGALLIGGHTDLRAGSVAGRNDAQLSLESTNFHNAIFVANQNTANGYHLIIGKTRGTDVNDVDIVQALDEIGSLTFAAADGTDLRPKVAQISAYVSAGTTPATNAVSGELRFGTTSQAQDTTTRMVLNKDGRLGIGTLLPETLLDVQKSSTALYTSSMSGVPSYTPSGSDMIQVRNTNTGLNDIYAGIWFETGTGATNTTGTDRAGRIALVVDNDTAYSSNFVFQTRGSAGTLTEKMRITQDGKVGIGTDDPDYTLDVTGQGRFTTDLRLGSENLRLSTDGSGEFGLGYGTTHTTANRFRVYQNTTPVFSVRDDGAIDTAQVRHSIRPTLNLDFANSKQLDPRITFYRDSIATYYDSKGILRYANHNEPRFDHDPVTSESKGLLIEEDREFLNYNTVTINNTFWGRTNATVSVKQAVAPDGTYSADGIHANTVNDGHGLFRAFVPAANTYYTITGYYKRGANRFVSHAWYYNEAAGNSNFPTAYYDLDNGTFTHTAGINRGTTMTDVGNGWYRCSLTVLSDGTPGTTSYFYATSATTSGAGAYVGTGAIDTYYWGLQVEIGAFPSSFMPSDTKFNLRASSATYYDENGIIRTAPTDGARYGYTSPYATEHWGIVSTVKSKIGSTASEDVPIETGLILEPAATNLEDYSYGMDASNHGVAISAGGSFAVTGDLTAPDGSYTASKFTFAGTSDRLDDVHGTFTVGDTYTLSMWVKGVAGQVVGVALLNNLGGNVEPYIYLTGDWQKISVTKTYDSQGTNIRTHGVIIRGMPGVAVYASGDSGGNGTLGTWATHVYVWGMQIEEGFSSTSYIPTYGGTATRAADIDKSLLNGESFTRKTDYAYIDIEKYNFWNNRESTIYAETETYIEDYTLGNYNASQYAFSPDTGRVQVRYDNTDGIHAIGYATPGGAFTNIFTLTPPTATFVTSSKTALSIKQDDYDFSVNGSTISGTASDNGGPFPAPTKLFLGAYREINSPANSEHLNGAIKKISYYDKKLTNAEMQALTENN